MRSRSVVFAIVLSSAAAVGAVVAHARCRQLRSEAGWLLERGSAQGDEYADTMDSRLAEDQLMTLDERRAVLDRAELWQRAEMLGVLSAVVGAFATYALYLFRRLREQLVEASAHLEDGSLTLRR